MFRRNIAGSNELFFRHCWYFRQPHNIFNSIYKMFRWNIAGSNELFSFAAVGVFTNRTNFVSSEQITGSQSPKFQLFRRNVLCKTRTRRSDGTPKNFHGVVL